MSKLEELTELVAAQFLNPFATAKMIPLYEFQVVCSPISYPFCHRKNESTLV